MLAKSPKTPLTASGSPCKLCLAKGSGKRCHLHSGTPSPKKTPKQSPKASPGSPKLDFFGKTPKPALYDILLNLEPKDLKKMTSLSKRAYNIFMDPRFKREYDVKHRFDNFFLGKRTITTAGRGLKITGKDGWTIYIEIITINEIQMTIEPPRKAMAKAKEPRQQPSDPVQTIIYFGHREDSSFEFSIFDSSTFEGFGWIKEQGKKWVFDEDDDRISPAELKVKEEFDKFVIRREKPEWVLIEKDGEIFLPPGLPEQMFGALKNILTREGLGDKIEFSI